MRYIIAILLIGIVIISCKNNSNQSSPNENQPKIFERLSKDKTGIDFINTIKNTEEFNIFSYRNFYNGGGVAIGDINNDGLSDVYMTSNLGKNKLYLNKGNMQFEDISVKAKVEGTKGWSTGVVMVDINNDGLLDIYVCNAGLKKGAMEYYTKEAQRNELFINNGDLTFTEKAKEYNLDNNGYTTHAAFFDYDKDGDLDAYILNNSIIQPDQLNLDNRRDLPDEQWDVRDYIMGGGDKMLRNDNGKFTDITAQSGIHSSIIAFGLGITVGDVNGDSYPDMYVSNDFYERDYLYINQKDGTFKDDIETYMQHLSLSSMGADMADINNDGYPEIFATEMLPNDEKRLKTVTNFDSYTNYINKVNLGFSHQYMHNTLQLNNQDETFSEIAFYSGVAASDWSWGALMFDADNDGYRDIYVSNGIYEDVIDQDFISFFANEANTMKALGTKKDLEEILAKMPSNPIPNCAFRNNGDLTFTDVADQWGVGEASFSNGAAYGDLDNDGDLDLIVNNVNQEAFVFQNNTNSVLKNHYLTVNLKGSEKNTFAIGSKVTVYKDKEILNFEMIPTRGFQSSIDYKMVFGLGKSTKVDKVEVRWMDNTITTLTNPKIDQILTIDYKTAERTPMKETSPPSAKGLVQEVENTFVQHKEDNYADFFYEGLAPKMISREGPCMEVGDLNGDGLEDVFIGGARDQKWQIYFQQANGGFTMTESPFKDEIYEDTAAKLFDSDGDGDLDLFIGSGGNREKPMDQLLQDRLYINDGKGNFQFRPYGIPNNGFNTSVIVPIDFDKDGDLDLFVGSRSFPGVYGIVPRSFLYENQGTNVFLDITQNVAPDFWKIGMVTDAKLVNVDKEQDKELVVVGEWMSPVIYKIKKGQFTRTKTNLSDYSGWWYSIETDDIDKDGDEDLILGNRGENFYLKGTKDEPIKLWVADFDDNKTYEKIITRQVNGKDMPVALKNDITSQIVSLKKESLLHSEFAGKSIQDLFSSAVMKKTLMREGNYFKSAVAINDGTGKFELKALPKEVQFSCVYDIYCVDLNGDKKKDLVLGGNDGGFLPQFSRLDASFGHVLISNGDGTYTRQTNKKANLSIKGEVRKIAPLVIKGERYFLAGINNKKPQLFKVNR
jgi:enediyne biosynthesis protein E4